MDKVYALIPLLGWFYITIGLFVLFSWITRDHFAEAKRLYYGAFGVIAFVFMAQSLIAEVQLFALSNKTLDDSFEQKMSNESSDKYSEYYVGLRPLLTSKDTVYIPNIATQEFHYLRAFLYPADVIPGDIPAGESLAVIPTGDLKSFPRLFEVLRKVGDKSFIRVEGVRR